MTCDTDQQPPKKKKSKLKKKIENQRKMPKSFLFFTVEKGLSSDPSGILGQQHLACWPCDSAFNSGRVLKRDPCPIHKSLNGDCPCV